MSGRRLTHPNGVVLSLSDRIAAVLVRGWTSRTELVARFGSGITVALDHVKQRPGFEQGRDWRNKVTYRLRRTT